MTRGRYLFYAIRKGKDPGLYTDWDDCKDKVLGVSNSEYKEFKDEQKAVEWLKRGEVHVPKGRNNDGERTLLLPMGGLRITTGGGRLLSRQEEGSGSTGKFIHVGATSGGSGEGMKEDIMKKANGPVFIEDMEGQLFRVCLFLCIAPPNFYRCECIMDNGESAMEFVVVLPHTRFVIKVAAEGSISTDERTARQDASSKMLGEIVLVTKLKIVDYNHQRVHALEGEETRCCMSDNSTQTTTEGLKRKMKTRVVDIRTSTDDQLVEHSAVERDGTEEGSKVSEGINARILNLLDRVEERLSQKDKVTGTIIKTHTEQIKNLTEVVVGNAKVSRRSCAVQKRGLPIATKSRGRSKKKDTKGEDTLSTKAKGKKHGAAAVNGNKSNIPPLKIDFDDDKDDDCRIEIMQQGHGTPFTYGTNMVMYMESADMPSCLDLLFRPPLGMEFVGSELAVAAYIFGNGLSKNRGVLHSLLPGEEVVDDVLNLVASMMTSSYLNEIGKRWWLPTTFA
ncbi:hypothetical protein S83_007847 [Arachis hypogaea]